MHASTQPRRGHRTNRTAKRPRSHQRLNDALRPVFEHLERRQLLTTLFVNDNWVVTTDDGNDGYGQGDTVENTGFGDNGLISGLTVYGPSFTSGTAFDSIAGALSVAVSGDIIRVISGTYSSLVNVNVADISLQGDNFGTAGTGVRVPETVLNGPTGSLSISANNVTVDGFSVRDALISTGTGITVGAVSGTQVINNIVTQNATGVLFSGSGNFTVSNNKFDSNNRAGPTRGQSVRVVSNTGTGTIQNNTFIGHTASTTTGAITLVGAAAVGIGSLGNGNIFGTNALDIRIGTGTTGTTIVANTFAATSTTYINNESAIEVNAASNSFDGVTPNLNNNVAQQNVIVNKIVDGVDVSGRGLVRINAGHVYVTTASFFAPTTTTPDIQRGVAVAVNSDIIHIEGGSYTGSVSTAGKNVTLAPGTSTAVVSITGNLTLDSTDTVIMEVNGLTPGTNHDQFSVTGTVALGGATLSTAGSTIIATAGQQVQLIANDLAEAVTGTFGGLLNGGNITVAGQPFVIFYNGGTGNDVILVRVPAAGPPAVVWVDDNWTGAISGTDQDGVGGGTAFGFDQFDNIQDAIDSVASGGTVHVAAGLYSQNIIVDNIVTILGPNAGIAGNGSRVAEAVVVPELSEPDPTVDPTSVVFYIHVDGVSIKGLTIDGDNTLTNSGLVRNSADIDASEGIASYEGIANLTIQNNIIQNFSFTGIDLTNTFNAGAGTSGNVITGNVIDNVGGAEQLIGYGMGAGVGILLGENFYASVTSNEITQVIVGLQTNNFYAVNPGAAGTISTNQIEAERIGILINGHYNNASTITVSGNTITGYDLDGTYLHWDGIIISSIDDAVDVTITNNDIDGTGISKESTGYAVWNTPTSATLSIVGGSVTDVDFGVHVNNYDTFDFAGGDTSVEVDGVDITADQVGVWVHDNVLGTGDVSATITGGTEIQSGGLGIGVLNEGTDATTTLELSDIHDNAIGALLDSGLSTVSGNQIYANGTGVQVSSTTTGSLISQNLMFLNTSEDILIDSTATATSVRIHENSMESTVVVTNNSAATIQASGNWWGTTDNPETTGRIAGTNAAGVDYSPWMHTNVDFDLDPANGFQGIFDVLAVDDNSPQSTYLSLAATRIAEGIAQVDNGGTVYIHAGSYTENVVPSGKSVALSPGDAGLTAQITINGDLTLDANDDLIIEASGTTPGTDHDQIIVTGTATLGGASLVPLIAYLPGPADILTVIDATTLAPGTFAGLAQGASIGSGFRIDYNAGLDEVRFVQNTLNPVADADGPYAINEGQGVTLDGSGSFDPDAFLGDVITNWDWDLDGDLDFNDASGQTVTLSWAQLQAQGINDGNANYTVRLRVTNNLNETDTDTSTITVSNVAPTITVTGAAASTEGSTYSLTLGSVVDPGADTISSYRINWGDGSPLDIYTPAQVLLNGGVLKHVYADDNPTITTSDPYTISVDLQDEDISPSYYAGVTTKTITVNNANPSPTIVGAPAQALVNVPITVTANANDPGVNDTFTYAWSVVKSGFGLFDSQTGPSSTFDFTPDDDATYTISLTVTDDDSGVGNAANVQVVAFESFKVLNFTSNGSGFSVQLNRPVDLDVLNLYDGADVPVDAADVTVTGALNPGTPIKGSLIWDAATNTAHWVASGGVLPADTYTVTLVSGAGRWTADTGPNPHLDGDGNGTGGDNYTNGFVIAASATRVVTVQDFMRGPSQNVVLPLGNTAGAGLPVRIDNAQNVTSVDFTIVYNPQLLNLTAVAKASGVPADWSLFSNVATPTVISATEWHVNVTLFTTINTVLSASAVAANLVQFTANVPASSGYGIAQVLRIENVVVAISGVSGAGRGDLAVHKVGYIGDVDGDTVYTGSDAGLIAGVVIGPHKGFDIYDLTDPIIIADVDANGSINGNDASFVAQKSVMAPRPEIPDRPVGTPPVAIGLDPTIDIPNGILANAGSSVIVPIQITDSAAGLFGLTVDISYDKNVLSLTNGLGSPDVTLGDLFDDGGWTLVANVDQANGVVHITMFRGDAFAVAGPGTIANLNMAVSNSAPVGLTNLTSSGFANQGGFSYTFNGGSVQVTAADVTGPALPAMTFVYDSGAPMRITAVWAENVSGPKTMTLTNLTTASGAPVTLNYSPNTGTYTFPSFGGGILPNGNYQAVINAANVTDGLGNPMVGNVTFNFFVLGGDANRDRVVDARDMYIMSSNWFGSGKTFSQGDFNYDGVVNQLDLTILSQNWQQSLPAVAAPALPSAPAPTTTSAPATGRAPARNPVRTAVRAIDLVQ